MSELKDFTRTIEQLQAVDPLHSVWVLANAGSGKTHVLVDRVVRLMLDGAGPDSILCLTFTKAAAAEMSLRLYGLLSSWIALADADLADALSNLGVHKVTPMKLARARQLFAIAIETPGGLKIQTIHAFCEKLLQLFPVEAGLAPGFRVMDETDRLALLRQATAEALAEAAAKGDESMVLLEDGGIATRDTFEALARRFLSATSVLRDVLADNVDLAKVDSGLREATKISRFVSTAEIEAALNAVETESYLRTATDFAPIGTYSGRNIGEYFFAIAKAVSFEDRSNLMFELFFTEPKSGKPRKALYSVDTKRILPRTCAWIDVEKERITELLTAHAYSLKIDATLALISLMRQVDRRFTVLKSAGGFYDFDDLIMRTAALVQDSPAAQWVLYKLDGNLSHILVDEAQDTSPAQWDIIRKLADEFFAGQGRARKEPRTLFVVGDIKQSIYSFQGADTLAFQAAQSHFQHKLKAAQSELRDVKLRVSYRSLPAVLEMVDVVFGKETIASSGLGPEAGDTSHEPNRKTEGEGTFEVWPIFKPLEAEERDHWQAPVDRVPDRAPRKRLAKHLAETIHGWIGKRLLVSKGRPVEEGDILILLQSRNELFDALIAELRQHGVAVAGADRLKLRENLAVLDLMALAQFCVLPEDDLALACLLKSPLLPDPFDDAMLTNVAVGRFGTLWMNLQSMHGTSENVLWLQECRNRAGRTGPHGFFATVLTRFRKAMLARLGEEALDATNTLLDVALDFERQEGTSLAAFLHWFMAREEDVKRELETGGSQLRIMTVHGAKGLEANIVILPDAADMPGPKGGSRLLTAPATGNVNMKLPFFDVTTDVKPEKIKGWKDDERDKTLAEKKRLLYVAMTRARDELYITGSVGRNSAGNPGTVSPDCWYGLIESALKKAELAKTPRSVEGVHPEGPLCRWGADPVPGATRGPNDGTAPEVRLPAWLEEKIVKSAAPPTWVGITTLARGESTIFDRAAAERGNAIHDLLENVDATTGREALRQRAEKRNLESTLADALHVLIRRADVAGFFDPASRTEAAIAGHVDGLPPVQGRVDRLLVQADQIFLLDYKSGRKPAETPQGYLRQMAGYCAVLAEAFPGRAINSALLWTQSGELQPLDSRQLSRVLDEMIAEHARNAT